MFHDPCSIFWVKLGSNTKFQLSTMCRSGVSEFLVGGGGWLRPNLVSNPTVSHQLELELELSVGLGSGWVLTILNFKCTAFPGRFAPIFTLSCAKIATWLGHLAFRSSDSVRLPTGLSHPLDQSAVRLAAGRIPSR